MNGSKVRMNTACLALCFVVQCMVYEREGCEYSHGLEQGSKSLMRTLVYCLRLMVSEV
jgi:hypothetical protein